MPWEILIQCLYFSLETESATLTHLECREALAHELQAEFKIGNWLCSVKILRLAFPPFHVLLGTPSAKAGSQPKAGRAALPSTLPLAHASHGRQQERVTCATSRQDRHGPAQEGQATSIFAHLCLEGRFTSEADASGKARRWHLRSL